MSRILRCVLVLSILLAADAADLYKALGVGKKATPQEIKKAFHKLSLKYHPDKNPSKNAQNKFAELRNAYEVLSDPEKRKNYDLTGDESGQARFQRPPNSGSGFPGGFNGGQDFFTSSHSGRSGAQKQSFQFNFDDMQNFQGWSDFGQFSSHFGSPRKEEAKQNSGWNLFGFPSFEKSGSSFKGFAGDVISSLFGGAANRFSQGQSNSETNPGNQKGSSGSHLAFASSVERLGEAEFNQKVLKTEREMWLVFFYSPSSRTPQLDEKIRIINDVSKDLAGLLKVGAVDCQSHGDICREVAPSSLKGAVNLLAYPYGTVGYKNAVQFPGTWTKKGVKDFCTKLIPNRSTRLDNKNLISRWSKPLRLPQAVLFTVNKDTSSKWRALSCMFHRQLDFYDIHVDENLDPQVAEHLGITRFPSVLGVRDNGKDFVVVPHEVFSESDSKIMRTLTHFLQDLEAKAKSREQQSETDQNHNIVPILTKFNFEKSCSLNTPLCVIAVADLSKGGNNAEKTLTELSRKSLTRDLETHGEDKQSVTYGLVDSSQQSSFVRAFTNKSKLNGQDVLLIAYKRRKGRFASRRGPLTLQQAESFVLEALSGDLTFETLSKEPSLV